MGGEVRVRVGVGGTRTSASVAMEITFGENFPSTNSTNWFDFVTDYRVNVSVRVSVSVGVSVRVSASVSANVSVSVSVSATFTVSERKL